MTPKDEGFAGTAGIGLVSLRAYLDGAGSMAEVPHLGLLADAIVVDRREHDAAWRAEVARRCRRLAEELSRDVGHADHAMTLSWAAEAYENNEVARRFEEALPANMLEELLRLAGMHRHPHRLLVTPLERFRCAACGEDSTEAKGVVVDDAGDVVYCPHCIGIAAAAVSTGAGRGAEADGPGWDPRLGEAVVSGPSPKGDRGAGQGDAPAPGGRSRRRLPVLVGAGLVVTLLGGSAGLASAGLVPPAMERIAYATLDYLGLRRTSDSPSPPCKGQTCIKPAAEGREPAGVQRGIRGGPGTGMPETRHHLPAAGPPSWRAQPGRAPVGASSVPHPAQDHRDRDVAPPPSPSRGPDDAREPQPAAVLTGRGVDSGTGSQTGMADPQVVVPTQPGPAMPIDGGEEPVAQPSLADPTEPATPGGGSGGSAPVPSDTHTSLVTDVPVPRGDDYVPTVGVTPIHGEKETSQVPPEPVV